MLAFGSSFDAFEHPVFHDEGTRAAPVFRSRPTTDRWTATVLLGDQPALRSCWERKDARRDRSYRRLTR